MNSWERLFCSVHPLFLDLLRMIFFFLYTRRSYCEMWMWIMIMMGDWEWCCWLLSCLSINPHILCKANDCCLVVSLIGFFMTFAQVGCMAWELSLVLVDVAVFVVYVLCVCTVCKFVKKEVLCAMKIKKLSPLSKKWEGARQQQRRRRLRSASSSSVMILVVQFCFNTLLSSKLLLAALAYDS